MPSEDEELIARFLQGEREAMSVIDGWISRAAWPYQRRLAAQWEDVLQEVRLQVTRLLRQGKFRSEASLKTYLWRVVNHTCVNQIRAQVKWQPMGLDGLIERSGPPEDSPLDQVLQKESEQVLLRVLEEMPSECRELWGMILAGLSYQQMSQRLGVSEGTLRQRVLRCRKKAVAVRDQLMGKKYGISM
jgi:RNA polymerase sigma-70 factor (ECF subfamily)